MNIKIAATLAVKYLAPLVCKIIKSKISIIGKSLYEKLHNKFLDALESFEKAIEECFTVKDPKKLKKKLDCCSLGFKFFVKMNNLLNEAIPEYAAALEEGKLKYIELTGSNDFENEAEDCDD